MKFHKNRIEFDEIFCIFLTAELTDTRLNALEAKVEVIKTLEAKVEALEAKNKAKIKSKNGPKKIEFTH